MFCPNCGHQVQYGEHCRYCNKKVSLPLSGVSSLRFRYPKATHTLREYRVQEDELPSNETISIKLLNGRYISINVHTFKRICFISLLMSLILTMLLLAILFIRPNTNDPIDDNHNILPSKYIKIIPEITKDDSTYYFFYKELK